MFCPKCGKENPEGTAFCASCGAGLGGAPVAPPVGAASPTKQAGGKGKMILIVAGVLVLLMIMCSVASKNKGSSSGSSSSSEAAIAVDASVLAEAYKANEVAADQQYKGKRLRVSGAIDNIGKDLLNHIYVSIKGDNIITDVQCMVSKDQENKAASLSKDMQITVEGKCKGKMMNVLLDPCTIQ